MANQKRNILFHLVIHPIDSEKEIRYVIFDRDPLFSTLSREEKKVFIRKEEQKIKKLITQKYRPQHISSAL